MGRRLRSTGWMAALAVTTWAGLGAVASAQTPAEPELLDERLAVAPAVTGLSQPTTMAFLGEDDLFVLEKASGQVKRVTGGGAPRVVLDLPVNSASERGLLGIALHPKFRRTRWVYLFWSESKTGADTTTLDGVRPLGNRIDRFEWDGRTLEYDKPILQFRAYQADAGQPLRGNHDGGVLRFGPDGKLYAIVGDTGRRGQLQNLADGPFGRRGPRRSLRRSRARRPAPHRQHRAARGRRLRARATTPSTASAAGPAGRSARTSSGSTPTACATRSGWTSTRARATCGSRRTATTASRSSTASSRG